MITREPVLRTERLSLFRPERVDLAAVLAVHGDPETNRHNPDGPMRSSEQGERWLRRWIEDWSRDGVGYFTVVRTSEPTQVIGFAGLKVATVGIARGDRPVDDAHEGPADHVRALNLYYRFRPSSWGQGLAAEAARAALDHTRPHHPELPAYALIRADNLASLRLAARLGFQATGEVDAAGRRVHLLGVPGQLTDPS
ncbi:GNAT family N-acetyltransferase [Kitasatospora cystarginea]|uniref:GNAT family N-acetyltransferase n=1 Tax=Kitasatospora cystarginea TaxID=58350 RepID=A0ABN3EKA3_9ACTN